MIPHAEDNSRRSIPRKAQEWCVEAEKAAAVADWTRAVVCYRRALEMAPFCQAIRDDFEWALEQQVEAMPPVRAKRNPTPATVEVVAVEPEEEDEAPSRRAAPQPRAKSLPRAPKRRAGFPSRTLAIAACLAIAVTIAGIGIAVGIAKMVGSAASGLDSRDLTGMVTGKTPPPELKTALMEGNQLLAAREPKRAAEKFRQAYKDHPDFAEQIIGGYVLSLRGLGASEMGDRRYEAAADAFEEATKVEPSNAANWLSLGNAYRELSRTSAIARDTKKKRTVLDDSEKAYREALKLEDGNGEALLGLAQVYSARNDRKLATQTFEKVVALAPNSREGQQARRSLDELKKK
ncbi:tetratricopeptide repeat protein [bacterium]|nr:tetratricopeptide repeat protein [bacterium]